MAAVFLALDLAIRVLRAAVGFGFINHPHLAAGEGFLGSLLQEPEYQALLDTIRSRWEALAPHRR